MRKGVSILFILLVSLQSNIVIGQFSKNYADHLDQINVGKIFISENKIDSAINRYVKAMAYFEDNKEGWFELGKLYERNENYSFAIKSYGMAVLKGYFPCKDQRFEGFPNEKSNKAILPFINSLDSLKSIFYSKYYNWGFSGLVMEMSGVDQFSRNAEEYITENDTSKIKKYYDLIAYVDTGYILKRILNYLDENPFPSACTLDESSSFWIIVHHCLQYNTSNELVAKLKAYILNAVWEGRYNLNSYIYTMDYYNIGKYKKQLYGTYKNKNKEGEYVYSLGIDSIQTVDKRRAEWHLLPIYLEQKVNELHPAFPDGYLPKTQLK